MKKRNLSRTVTQIQDFFCGIVAVLFGILMASILVATLLLDKNIGNNPFPNMSKWSNGGYYLFAACILCFLVWLYLKICRRQRKIRKRKFYMLIICIAVVTLVLQTIIALWTPEIDGGDFGSVRAMAISLTEGGNFGENGYFVSASNNVNIAILLSWIYRLTSSWRGVIWMGAFLTNLSVILMVLLVYRLTGNKFAAVTMEIAGEILVALAWRTYMPYTDNWGMPFAIGAVFLYLSDVKKEIRVPGTFLLGLAGSWIKVTAMIPLLGIIGFSLLKAVFPDRGNRREMPVENSGKRGRGETFFKVCKKVLPYVLCCTIVAGGGIVSSELKEQYGYVQAESLKGWQYFLMVGQNNSAIGQVGGSEYRERWEEIQEQYPNREDRMRECLSTALEWIMDRELIENIKFYTKKLNVAYNDGQFHNVQPYQQESVVRNLIYEIYDDSGLYYTYAAGIKQVVWDFVLILLAAEIPFVLFHKKEKKEYTLFKIMILGIVLYMMLFEGRSKYLYMFLPIYLSFAGLILGELLQLAGTVQEMVLVFRDRNAEVSDR